MTERLTPMNEATLVEAGVNPHCTHCCYIEVYDLASNRRWLEKAVRAAVLEHITLCKQCSIYVNTFPAERRLPCPGVPGFTSLAQGCNLHNEEFRAEVEEHLDHCAQCRSTLALMRPKHITGSPSP